VTICLVFEAHLIRFAASFAFFKTGSRIEIRSAMTPMTTNSSTSVNPRRFDMVLYLSEMNCPAVEPEVMRPERSRHGTAISKSNVETAQCQLIFSLVTDSCADSPGLLSIGRSNHPRLATLSRNRLHIVDSFVG
jgi:hypothetical protein